MKFIRCALLLSLALPFFPGARLHAAVDAAKAAGHWEGEVTLPNAGILIRVDLAQNAGSWEGTIDIPMQGLRNYKLDPLTVDASGIIFGLPGIPGEPKFSGRLAEDAKTISGNFAHSGQAFQFKLERKAPTVEVRDETPAIGIPGKGIVGYWRASLKPMPQVEFRLAMAITAATPEKSEGVIINLDQGGARIPIGTITEKDEVIHIDVPRINAVFHGKFSIDGSELAGNLQQNGVTTPLVYKRAKQPPAASK